MSMSIKKRLALGAGAVATVGAVATLVAGVTFGLFTSSPVTQNNTFASGTVTLTQTAASTCTVSNIVPGDLGTCTLQATYSGSAPAFVGLDTVTASTMPDLVLSVSDGTNTYLLNGTNLFVAADNGAPPSSVHNFTVSWSLPLAAGNADQGKTASVGLTVHAVQSQHNGSSSGCTPGAVCVGITAWA